MRKQRPKPGNAIALRALQALTRIAEAFEEEMGRKPTLGELVEVLAWSVPSSDEILERTPGPVVFSVQLRPGLGAREPTNGEVAELGDWVFAEATEALADLAREMVSAFGSPVTIPELAAALGAGLGAASGITADIQAGDVLALESAPPNPSTRPRIGDIVVIPEGDGGYRLAVLLARNHWGTAFGLFSDTLPSPRLPSAPFRGLVTYAVHSDEQQIVDGAWSVVGHDEGLISRFPEPEIYHAPNSSSRHAELHAYGAAETPDGRLRPITEQEAQRVGLADGSYEQNTLSEYLQQRLSSIR